MPSMGPELSMTCYIQALERNESLMHVWWQNAFLQGRVPKLLKNKVILRTMIPI
jgi:hypothetical protein